MDDEPLKRTQKPQMKRLYHKPVTKSEAKQLAAKFGNLIYDHITIGISKIKEKETKGTNGTNGTFRENKKL